MTLESLDGACPHCRGNLHFDMTFPHRTRRGYDVHRYRCLDCGPMLDVTQWSDEVWPQRWDGPRFDETVVSKIGYLGE